MTKGVNNIQSNEHSLPLMKRGERAYFIGIGGIGMSALARYFKAKGTEVSGYDKTRTDITENLEALGISVNYVDEVSVIEKKFLVPEQSLIIYTPAIPENHNQLGFFKSNGYQLKKRSEILGEITEQTFSFAIAGTHGKTTTTSILGYLLNECQIGVTAFLGGISENYNSNLILSGTDVSVVEADEFDRSFLTLSPNYACITSMDADHLDIYGDTAEMKKSFEDFSQKVKPNGKLFVKKGLPLDGITYGIEDDSDYSAQNIKIEDGSYHFDIVTPNGRIENFQFDLPGRHNLSNALIALAMCIEYGVSPEKLRKVLSSYKGVKRRFSYQIKSNNLIFIDDYAHHPTEIDAIYQAVTEMYAKQKVLAIFQPHLFSRTRDFADEFAKSLSQFDQIVLLDIYPAREDPIEGINSKWLLAKIENKSKSLIAKDQIINTIRASDAKVILTLGAGDIGNQVKLIKAALSHEN